MSCKIERIYESEEEKAIRVLVDRVWPRGISKDKANLDHWLKEIAPSDTLRKWFNHDPDKFSSFKEKYKKELKSGEQQEALEELKEIYKKSDKKVVLLYSAKDEKNNQAVVLIEIIDHQKKD
ncbi:DUF488 family protein [Mammaliicoccus fleurettii]|nr:DUF488 family protein [Mammaliicoccus fleurettii]